MVCRESNIQTANFVYTLKHTKSRSFSLSPSEMIVSAICKVYSPIYRPMEYGENKIYLYVESLRCYREAELVIESLVVTATGIIQTKTQLSTLIKDVLKGLRTKTNQIIYNPPPVHWVAFKSYVMDMKTNEVVPEEQLEGYHFLYRHYYDLKDEEDPTYLSHKPIFDRVFLEWSNGNEEIAKSLKDYLRFVMEQNSRGHGLLIYGPSGSGKSTYIQMGKRLAGQSRTCLANICDMEKEFILNNLSESTTLIVGDEITFSYNMSNISLIKMKQLLDGQPIAVNEKHKPMRVVTPQVCFIQAMNTDVDLNKVHDVVKDRFMFVKWTSTNFRRKKREGEHFEFNVDKLLKDNSVIGSLATYIVENTEYVE